MDRLSRFLRKRFSLTQSPGKGVQVELGGVRGGAIKITQSEDSSGQGCGNHAEIDFRVEKRRIKETRGSLREVGGR